MRRREFIGLWPLVARTQQADRVRRIGYLNSLAETDLDGRTWDSAFRIGLTELGWIEDRLRTFTTEISWRSTMPHRAFPDDDYVSAGAANRG